MKTALQELIERLEKEAKATKNPAIEIGILRSFIRQAIQAR